jgi:hypothetical protein
VIEDTVSHQIDPRTIKIVDASQEAVPSAGSPKDAPKSAPPEVLDAPDARTVPGWRDLSAGLTTDEPSSESRALVARMGYLARDQLGNGCLVARRRAHNPAVYALNSSQFEGLVHQELRKSGIRLAARELRACIDELKAEAAFRGVPVQVDRRVARTLNGDVVIALHDEKNTHVRISPNQVLVMAMGSDQLFYRSPFALPMVGPADAGDAKLLKKYINLKDDQFILYLAWVTYTLAHGKREGTTFPLLVLVGGQGTGKSHLSKATITLVDPSSKGVERLPSKLHDMAISSQSGHLLVYDNLRHLTAQQSDSLCIMATGGAATTRKLYTDDEQKLIQMHCAVVLNSIVGVVEQPDLAQRSLTLRLEPMAESARRSDDELFREFAKDLPAIMRGLFDLIAKILACLPSAVVTKPQRMVGFVRWIAAMERAQGLPEGVAPYQDLFAQVMSEGQLDSLQDNVVGAAILQFAEGLNEGEAEWQGTPADLYAKLTDAVLNDRLRMPRDWPDNAIALSKRLVSLQAALMTQGISVTFKRGKTRTIAVRKLGGQ